jgi:hypothetical protein
VAAEKMLVATDCPILEACTPVVDVDLRRVPLSDYRGLRAGSWVLVDGIVSHDNGHQRLVATSIMLVEEWQSP